MDITNFSYNNKYGYKVRANLSLSISMEDSISVERPGWTDEVPQDGIKSVG